ncbi:MAG TPA: glycosyltransferase family 4 protein [Burkholderiales bacterium]|nr:glycosyltransferase family 4 protein [Burkholderiales bacterium]
MTARCLRVLTWHVHGNYLYYLTQVPHDFYIVSKPGRPAGYAGRAGRLPWGDNVHDAPADAIKDMQFDCVLYQARGNYADRHTLLSEPQRRLPQIYLEHDPPQEHPTDTCHPVDDPNVLLVHVSGFNDLMWNNRRTPHRVIEHGVLVPDGVRYTGEVNRGLVVVNHLVRRGRRLGADIYEQARSRVPLTLVGMAAEEAGGAGEVANTELPEVMSHFRFFFHPIRYTSLGLALIEAMMVGMPIVGLATTELVTVVRNGVTGFVDTRVDRLVEAMQRLLADPAQARTLGAAARQSARERFNIRRFAADWDDAFAAVTQ